MLVVLQAADTMLHFIRAATQTSRAMLAFRRLKACGTSRFDCVCV
jgi:hypothetical protein